MSSTNNQMNHYYQNDMFEDQYFTYPSLYSYAVEQAPSNARFVEIGCWKGQSVAYLGVEIHNSGKNITLDCVDVWTEESCGSQLGVYEKFLQNTKSVSHIIKVVRQFSVDASKLYEDNSLDFVFIDGDHKYDAVVSDIQAWLPKVKSKGILAGHDYAWCTDVRKAVHDTLGEADGKYTDAYGVGYSSYDDPWREGCWIVNID